MGRRTGRGFVAADPTRFAPRRYRGDPAYLRYVPVDGGPSSRACGRCAHRAALGYLPWLPTLLDSIRSPGAKVIELLEPFGLDPVTIDLGRWLWGIPIVRLCVSPSSSLNAEGTRTLLEPAHCSPEESLVVSEACVAVVG
jgi:hypothetical protein